MQGMYDTLEVGPQPGLGFRDEGLGFRGEVFEFAVQDFAIFTLKPSP